MTDVSWARRRRTTRNWRKARPAAQVVASRWIYADSANRLWVANVTPVSPHGGRLYVPTLAEFVYLSILDMFSRRIVGWAVVKRARPERVLNTLNKTVEQRQADSVIEYADQERRRCAYFAFGERYQ